MEFEKLLKLDMEKKKELLYDLINDDVSYWKKILILMSMVDENEDVELLDLIIDNKLREIELANKKYNLNLKQNETKDKNKIKNYASIMESIVNGSDDLNYSKASREVLEILKFIPKQYYDSINKKFIERLEENANKEYNFKILENYKYTDLNILKETQDILSIISDKFWNKNGEKITINQIFNKLEE